MAALLEIQNLHKAFARKAVLTDLSLAISAGNHLLLIGPSGGGKSTLLRLIAGLDGPDRGTIRIDGQLASEGANVLMRPHRRGVAMVFQDLGLWPNLTAYQNVALGLAGMRLSRREKTERTQTTLELCELGAKSKERPSRLSAGEQQRVALARAMAVRPKLLLLDEPFTGLDLMLKNSLVEHISRLVSQFGTTVLLVSHNPFDAAPLSARLAVLEDGRICEADSFEQLQREPRSRTLRAWANRISGA